MDGAEHCYSVLLVSASAKFNESLSALLPERSYHPITVATDVASARRLLLEGQYDIVLINTPLPDDLGVRLALDVCSRSGAGVLLLLRAEHYPDISARVSAYGVLAISKPTSPQMILQSLQLLCGTRERLRRMEQKTASIEEKMEEIRLVNRAKWLLIEQLKMTEKEAHRYIEKQAMDRCVTRRKIAESILAIYQT